MKSQDELRKHQLKKDNCKGILGRLFGHNFKTIYDTKSHLPTDNLLNSKKVLFDPVYGAILGNDATNEALRNLRTNEKIYIKSVCSRCGKTINK